MNLLPPLPKGFWNLFQDVLDAWTLMHKVLDQEWIALQGGKINLLPGIAEKKNKIGQHIENVEKRLEDTIGRILQHSGKYQATTSNIASFRRFVHHTDLSRLSRFISKRKLLIEEARQRNRRHMDFIENRLELNRKLMDILTGASKNRPLTYAPDGKAGTMIRTSFSKDRRISQWLA